MFIKLITFDFSKKKMDLKKIILSRTDAIGDVILTLPLAAYLKKVFPETQIIFLGKDYTKDIIENCPFVDSFISWNAIEKNAVSEFQKINADAILHIFPQSQIAKAASKAGIPIRVGTSHRTYHWNTCNRIISFSRKRSDMHEAQLNFHLLKGLDISYIPELEEFKEINLIEPKQELREDLKEILNNGKFNLILHPGSKGSAREWGVDRFAELIKILPKNKIQIFITGTEKEGLLFRKDLVMPFPHVVDLTGLLSLKDLMLFIKNCDGIVAESTGPLHIGSVLGIHAIGIYPPIRPMHPGRWAPIGKKTKVFVKEKNCSDCRKSGRCKCMREIASIEVADYITAL